MDRYFVVSANPLLQRRNFWLLAERGAASAVDNCKNATHLPKIVCRTKSLPHLPKANRFARSG
jgi:hypothetical protein